MTSKGDQKDIERRLQSIIGSMRISGGEPTEETIITMRGILSGALDADEEIERIVARYKINRVTLKALQQMILQSMRGTALCLTGLIEA